MKPANHFLLIGLLATLPLLVACNRPTAAPANDPGSPPTTAVGQQVREATAAARSKLATENITVSTRATNLPKAEVSPQGELLIGGQQVAINDAQRQLLLDYRANVVAVAEAGMEIGVQGADLGVKAAGEALKGIFSGNPGQVEEKIKAEAEQIKLAAAKLCEQLPAVKDSQEAAAAAIPEFKPYASMDQSDIDNCRVN